MAQIPLTPEQRRTLIRILVTYGQIHRPSEREYFFDVTGLSEEVPEVFTLLGIESATDLFANNLINFLLRKGILLRTKQPSLLLVLRYLHEEVSGHPTELQFLENLIKSYESDNNIPVILGISSGDNYGQKSSSGGVPSVILQSYSEIFTSRNIKPEQQRLLDIMQDMHRTIRERAQAGIELGEIGDPRPGVGLREDGVPDIFWCEIPDEGEIVIGDRDNEQNPRVRSLREQKVKIPTFWIAKYPITFRQFQAFIDDNGFENNLWWEQEDDRSKREQYFKYWNHPRTNMTWYAARAFCKWLSAKLGMTVRLPTEEEWEKAARGKQGRFYPWGYKYISGYANIHEKYNSYEVGPHYLNQTSTVGIYPPESASPYGAMEMVGNVWEWTLSARDDKDKASELQSREILHRSKRIARGGSWFSAYIDAWAISRYGNEPGYGNRYLGFRVVSPSASSR